MSKEFKDNRPLTTYHLTEKGRKEFEEYVETLNYFLQEENKKH